jgi:hypothetical protein
LQLKRDGCGRNIRIRAKRLSVRLAGVDANDRTARQSVEPATRLRRMVFAQRHSCLLAALLVTFTPLASRAESDGERRDRNGAGPSGAAPSDASRDAAVSLRAPHGGGDADQRNLARFQRIDPATVSSRVSRFGDSGIDGFLAPVRVRTNATESAAPGVAEQRPAQAAAVIVREAAPPGKPMVPAGRAGGRGAPVMRNRDVQPARNLDEIAPAPTPAVAVPVDPYEPTGVVVDSFLFKPALEIAAGYDSNPERRFHPRGSPVVVATPELSIRSQFERHQLNADIRAGFTETTSVENANHPTVDAKVAGRYDVADATHVTAEAHYTLDALITAGFAKQPLVHTAGGSAGVTQSFGPAEIAVKGSLDRIMFTKGAMADFRILDTQDRNFTQPGVELRVSYVFAPQISPFVDVAFDRRIHDLPVDFNGLRRDSDGVTARVGAAINFGALVGEASVGYLSRSFNDRRMRDIRGVVADATLAWAATDATTFVLVARSQASETPAAGISGILSRDVIVQADHKFAPWLIGTVRGGIGHDQFWGTSRIDERFFVGLGGVYKFSRMLQFKGDLRAEWTRSNNPANNVMAIVGLLGVRLQY